MLSKAQLSKFRDRYTFKEVESSSNNNITTRKFHLFRKSNGTKVGRIKLTKHSSDLHWMVSGVSCKIQGLGKLLYYNAMDAVYPRRIVGDLCGISYNAIQVWKALDKVPYVDSFFRPDFESWEYEDGDYFTGLACKFKW